MNFLRQSFTIRGPQTVWRYADSLATSQKVILSFLAIIFINSFIDQDFLFGFDFAVQFQITLLATFFAWAYFTVVGFVIRYVFKTFSYFRVAAISILYATTEVVRFFVLFNFFDSDMLTRNLGLPFLIAGAFATGLLFLASLSIVFLDLKNYRTAYETRLSRLEMLEGSLSKVEETVRSTYVQFVSEVRKTLQRELNSALKLSSKRDDSASVFADELFRVSDEVVRPLSASFARSTATLPQAKYKEISARPPLKELVRLATTSAPFRPVELAIVTMLLSLSTLFAYESPIYLFFWSVFLVSVFGLNWLAMTFITPHMKSWNVVFRIIVITMIVAIPLTLYLGFVFIPSLDILDITPGVIVYLFFISAVVGWLVTISQGVAQGRDQILSQLTALENQLRWANVRAQCSLWLDQRKLALVLHNQVQGNLLASAMKLKKSIERGHKATPKTIAEVQQRILEPLNLENDSRPPKSLADVKTEINNTWAPLITLSIQCTPELVTRLERDPVAFEIVTEIMTEFQTNSLKYGSASHTHVEITEPGERVLAIRMSNNGKKMSAEPNSLGLGTQFFDSIALLHTTQNTKEGVQVYIEIPFLPEGSF